jgi:hypothetical protein
VTPGIALRRGTSSSLRSGGAPAGTVTRMAAYNDSKRSRNSPSKPFITDRMTIRAATPTPTPANEIQVMNDTKNACERDLT